MFFLKFISFTAFITWQFSTAAAESLTDLRETVMIQDVLKKVDEQLNAPSYAKLIDVLERSQSGNTVTYNVKASSSTCLLSDKVNKNPNFYIKFVMKMNQSKKEQLNIDFSMEHFEPLNMLNKTQRKYVMPRLKYILQDTAEDNEYDVYRKIKSVDSVSQSGHVTKVQLTVTETNCPVKGENIYYGWSLQKNCDDMKKPYKCTILYIASNKRSAKVDCAETVVNVEEEIDEESQVQNVLKNTDEQTNADSYTKLLKILYKIKNGTTTLYEIEASKSECSLDQRSFTTGYRVLRVCPAQFPVMTCTVTITDKSTETGSVECEEIDLSMGNFLPITPQNEYQMREIKNQAESILFDNDSKRESGVYRKLISIDEALNFGSVKKIELTAADTDCKVAGENAYTGVDVADDCHELSDLHECTIVYLDSLNSASRLWTILRKEE
ncbi:hypothetical protein T10_33 [Trichinella papuae]|uniref:Uncharacterized protein n=1 Tax=Trichinella papuae TaxID=268474 RepID=A0A0V1MJ55_9BILA|nr:hypothetical protein T10_33 [Trichinella papuae]